MELPSRSDPPLVRYDSPKHTFKRTAEPQRTKLQWENSATSLRPSPRKTHREQIESSQPAQSQVPDINLPELFPKTHALYLPQEKVVEKTTQAYTEERALARHALEEKIVLIYASIHSGDLDRAEITFNRAWRTNFHDMKELVDARILNAFIDTHLNSEAGANIDRALDWYERFTDLDIQRNGSTFAILIQYYLQLGKVDEIKRLIGDMDKAGVTVADLLDNDRFVEKEDRAPLEAILREMGRKVDGVVTADRLFLSALEEAGEGKSESTGTSPSSSSFPSLLLTEMATGQSAPKLQERVPLPINSTNSLGINVLTKALKDMEARERTNKYDQQQWLEERTFAAALEGFEEAQKRLPEQVRRLSQIPSDLASSWNQALVPLIEREIQMIDMVTEDAEDHEYGPFLKLIKPEQLSRIVITEFIRPPSKRANLGNGVVAGETSVASLTIGIARSIEAEYNAQQVKKHSTKQKLKLKKVIHHMHTEGKLFHLTVRRVIQQLASKHLYNEEEWKPKWPDAIRVKIGSVLVKLMLQVAKVRVTRPDPNAPGKEMVEQVPAFSHVLKRIGHGHKLGMIQYHPALYEALNNTRVSVDPWLLPMLVAPRPWITWQTGGYLQHRSSMVRTKSGEAKRYLGEADRAQILGTVTRALDVLGSIPWRINEDIYNVAAQMWNSNEHAPSLPAKLDLPEVEKPANLETDPLAKRKYWFLAGKRDTTLRENFSQRADTNYKLEIAKAFIGETIYFPHNLDFRGRAYPMPAHLNHIGNDLCRGLLLFDQGKPLGEAGMRWLKIHVAALAGFDKASFGDRERWTDDHMVEIEDSVDRPLDGKRWWLKAENPWQLLAACFELVNALRSGKPLQYISRLPVHQDGTCNGLQHYAALGGDEIGAQQVNLLPGHKPADVYTGVAERLQLLVDQDVASGVPEAILMQNRINRKLVKQTVMTNTYGVTFVGARAQVRNRLKESRAAAIEAAKTNAPADSTTTERLLTDDDIDRCSLYITRQIFSSMGQIFEGARAIQNWLNVTAGMIARSTHESDIPEAQLEDAEELARLGVLPSAFTLAREERRRVEIGNEEGLLGAALQDLEDSQFDEDMSAALKQEQSKRGEVDEDDDWTEDLDDTVAKDLSSTSTPSPTSASPAPAAPAAPSKKPPRVTSVIWTTPLGLPIVQPYRNFQPRSVQTLLQTITIYDFTTLAPVNAQKQSTAFPPNFIHSLDAAHMMLSAIQCQRAGLSFASVHDSYWTHASDVNRMNEIIRNEFVTLHSGDIMTGLRNEFVDRYAGHKIPVEVILEGDQLWAWKLYLESKGRKAGIGPKTKVKKVTTWVDLEILPLPARGNFEIKQVKDSRYFFH
ncbi:DNA-directed RNA polymerase [Spizellomyces sp. 'palustris']|nr:DNA-directed RNA polymerase [Spizellomyces sp. 'palustris']